MQKGLSFHFGTDGRGSSAAPQFCSEPWQFEGRKHCSAYVLHLFGCFPHLIAIVHVEYRVSDGTVTYPVGYRLLAVLTVRDLVLLTTGR